MGINTSETLKAKAADKADEREDSTLGTGVSRRVAEHRGPKPDDAGAKTREAVDKADKVKVKIPAGYGPQTVQINGENFTTPAGEEVEVAADVAALLKGSGALDPPPGAA